MKAKPNFAPIAGVPASDDELEAFAMQRGIPTLQPPQLRAVPTPEATEPPAPSPSETKADSPQPPQGRLTLELPVYLIDDLRMTAARNKCSVRHLIMKALAGDGHQIQSNDLVSDRRRSAPMF